MPWFQNGTCDPFHPETLTCTLGNLVEYSINATSAAHVAAGLKFAQSKNIRLAIKNTGHDFLGRSTAKYGLGIWTHNLNAIDINLHYNGTTYKGPAIKIGSGTQAAAAYEAAHAAGYRVLGGTCPTVGLAGGYTQGGGHSALSSLYGLSADNVLEWEVVTADGSITIASPAHNSDLYWALSGGGGGSYGTVISMTSKMYPESPTGGATLSFNTSSATSNSFWNAIAVLQGGVTPIVDAGAVVLYQMSNKSITAFVTAPSLTRTQITNYFEYMTDHLISSKIPYTFTTTTDSTYFDHFSRYYGPLPNGIYEVSHLIGSRLIPRSVVAARNQAIISTYRDITASGDWSVVSIALNASHATARNSPAANAVLPAWRDALLHTLAFSPWDWDAPISTMQSRERLLSEIINPALVNLAPGSGTYMNEANFNQSDAEEAFFGRNLGRLRSIKKKYDPFDLFYAPTAIGSEAWVPDTSGRLCRPM
ncbi:MAG: hypothetical protein Q9195_007953 [Heterodermia aff. obscurata]